jgi:hypothetical protein
VFSQQYAVVGKCAQRDHSAWHGPCFPALMNLRAASILAVLVAAAGCPAPGVVKPPPDTGRTFFGFDKLAVDQAVTPLWGDASTGAFVAGGVQGSLQVVKDVLQVDSSSGTLKTKVVGTMTKARMCNCALFDESRNELLVVGGRDEQFADNNDAEIVNTATGENIAIDANGAGDHPIGCQAFFSTSTDKGYIFGGLSSTVGNFSPDTYRYDPASHTITKIDGLVGPPARYDAAIHQLDNGDVLMVSGMGSQGLAAKFFQDMWIFDAAHETWSEQKPDAASLLPPGRRYAWTSLAPDESELLYGFGSDSPTGQHMLGDFWAYDFAAKTWNKQAVDGLPSARGFSYKWQGPPQSAGALAFGIDNASTVFADAYVMTPPDDLAGNWH